MPVRNRADHEVTFTAFRVREPAEPGSTPMTQVAPGLNHVFDCSLLVLPDKEFRKHPPWSACWIA